jgi:hypothetical protein
MEYKDMTINDIAEDKKQKMLQKRIEKIQMQYLDMSINSESYDEVIKEYSKKNDEFSKKIVKENKFLKEQEQARMKMLELSFNKIKVKIKPIVLKTVDKNDASNIEKLNQNGKNNV